jgi:hypothetical protein
MISFFLFFLFIFDSGGNFGIRNFGFLLMGVCIVKALFQNKIIFNRSFLLLWFGLVSYLIVNLGIAIQNDAQFLNANIFNFSMYSLLFFYILAINDYLNIEGYLSAVNVFAVIVIIIFFGRLFKIDFIVELYRLFPAAGGTDSMKNNMVAVYYQGALSLVPGGVIFACRKKTGWFLLCLTALAVAPSRFGVLVSVVFFLIIYRSKIYIPVLIAILLFLMIVLLQIDIPVLYDFLDMFLGESYGNRVRSGHLYSILDLLKDNPSFIFWGQGSGTAFYTAGFHSIADSVEISHFDFIRKYGFPFFGILTLGLLWTIFRLLRSKENTARQLAFAVISHYVVAISNPVLTSLPAMMLICVAIVKSERIKCAFVHS